MKIICKVFILSVMMIFSLAVRAASIEGDWTVYDSNHNPKSNVQVWVKDNILFGKITKLYQGDTAQTCTKCKGAFKNKPLVGMVILWNVRQQSDIKWTNGKLLAPKKGKAYDVDVNLSDDGKTLTLTVKAGMFSKKQTWSKA